MMLSQIAPMLAAALVDVSVKAVPLAALAWVTTRHLTRARHRHDVWLASFGLLSLVPLVSITRIAGIAPRLLEDRAFIMFSPSTDGLSTVAVVLLMLWAIGYLVALLRLFTGYAILVLDGRTLEPMSAEEWARTRDAASSDLGIGFAVRLLRGDARSTPQTWGIWRPVIVLPAGSEDWPSDLRRNVMLHELAHVRSRDSVKQFLVGIWSAILWFHPAVWLMIAALNRERERRCDEIVLAAGASRDDYAEHLLTIARRGSRNRSLVATLVHPGEFESRIRALLIDQSVDRPRHRRMLATLVPVVAVGILFWQPVVSLTPMRTSPRVAGGFIEPPGGSPATFRSDYFGRR
jgi:beta-lactamase regulating signal transducer with metallopeptidase domain